MLTPRNAFKIDKKGDKNNFCFDTIHFKQLCKYNLPRSEKDFNQINRFNKDSVKKKMSRKQLRRLQINEAKEKRYFTRIKYIKLEVTPKEIENKSEYFAQSTLSNKMWLYLEMKQDLEENEEDLIDLTSDFMKYLNENKTDINKWLEFIDYQAKIINKKISKTNDNESQYLNLNQATLFERKQAIFERAIKENPDNFRLKIELIKLKANSIEMTNYFDSVERIESEFFSLLASEIVKLNTIKPPPEETLNVIQSNLFEIWFELIKFFQNNNSSSITFNRIKRLFIKCFSFFINNSNKHLSNLLNTSEYYLNNLLKIFECYCLFLTKSGYFEKAIGTFQALIDFNFCTHSQEYKNLDFKNRLTLFELFWDMGLPKFGEKFTDGWIICLENRDKVFEKIENDELLFNRYDDFLDTIESQIVSLKNVRIELRWLEIERLRALFNWYPFYPKTVIGESSDDCIDQDRLISFEDDLSFCLFDLNFNSNNNTEEKRETLKFKLFCKFLNLFNLIRIEDESLDLNETSDEKNNKLNFDLCFENFDDDNDEQFVKYLAEQFTISKDLSNSFLSNLFQNYFGTTEIPYEEENLINLKNKTKSLIINTLDFMRNCLKQAMNYFQQENYKTSITILQWKLELEVLYLLTKSKDSAINENHDYFHYETVKQNLMNQTKLDLSLERNRSNFRLWKQYGILKWILNSHPFCDKPKNNLKETRKIFDTLLKTSESSIQTNQQACIDIYSLCTDFVELELGIYYKNFDVSTTNSLKSLIETETSLSTIHLVTNNTSIQNVSKLKETLSEMIANSCLNKTQSQVKSKSKSTFQIEMTGSTKLLLTKRDFQLEYESLKNCKNDLDYKKLFYYHKIYTLFLLCTKDIKKLIEINDIMLKEPLVKHYHSKLIEFYLSILNYLYLRESKITKFMYKTKLFAIIKSIVFTNKKFTKSFLNLLELSLMRFKLDNSVILVNQLIENNDIDLMFKQISLKLANKNLNPSNICLSQIYTFLVKLDRVTLKTSENDDQLVSNLGIHHQIRRLFQNANKLNSKSLNLWLSYFRFETLFNESNFNQSISKTSFYNQLLSIYYQSIRNLPHFKILYLTAVKCLPDKYNEIINVMDKKEIRVYIPIQELNILLEPIRKPNEEDTDEDKNKLDQSDNSINELESDSDNDDDDDDTSDEMEHKDEDEDSSEIEYSDNDTDSYSNSDSPNLID